MGPTTWESDYDMCAIYSINKVCFEYRFTAQRVSNYLGSSKTGFYCTAVNVSSSDACLNELSSHQIVILYRWNPVIRVSPEHVIYCTEGAIASECPFMTGLNLWCHHKIVPLNQVLLCGGCPIF